MAGRYTEEEIDNFVTRLQAAMNRRSHTTNREAGEAMGIPSQTLWNWLYNKKIPKKAEHQLKIAKYCGANSFVDLLVEAVPYEKGGDAALVEDESSILIPKKKFIAQISPDEIAKIKYEGPKAEDIIRYLQSYLSKIDDADELDAMFRFIEQKYPVNQ